MIYIGMMFTMLISEEDRKKLKDLAEEEGRSSAEVVRRLIRWAWDDAGARALPKEDVRDEG